MASPRGLLGIRCIFNHITYADALNILNDGRYYKRLLLYTYTPNLSALENYTLRELAAENGWKVICLANLFKVPALNRRQKLRLLTDYTFKTALDDATCKILDKLESYVKLKQNHQVCTNSVVEILKYLNLVYRNSFVFHDTFVRNLDSYITDSRIQLIQLELEEAYKADPLIPKFQMFKYGSTNMFYFGNIGRKPLMSLMKHVPSFALGKTDICSIKHMNFMVELHPQFPIFSACMDCKKIDAAFEDKRMHYILNGYSMVNYPPCFFRVVEKDLFLEELKSCNFRLRHPEIIRYKHQSAILTSKFWLPPTFCTHWVV